MSEDAARDAVPPGTKKRFAFVFPMASGHVNPSLPIARRLVQLGHEVHYLCREQMREAIEDTGASFHSDVESEPEMYEGRTPSLFGAVEDLQREFGLQDDPPLYARFKLREVMIEMMLPGAIRWLQRIQPASVVYCPLLNAEAALAAKTLGIPRIALLVMAGPGSMAKSRLEQLTQQGLTPRDIVEMRRSFPPLQQSLDRMNAAYGLSLDVAGSFEPLGLADGIVESNVTLITTCEALQDPMPDDLAQAYQQAQVRFASVGPLLDVAGACRAAGHKFQQGPGLEASQAPEEADTDMVAMAREARAAGRRVILVSMGTVITGDSTDFGWHAQPLGRAGQREGLTGMQLCQAAWGGAFDAFGSEEDPQKQPPLLLLALGPQPKALGELQLPRNAFGLPTVPQVDLLKVGVDVFLTHGGQNSFVEALSEGVPLVVCPGFADQPVNAQKAVDMGVGLQVPRPVPAAGEEARAVVAYRKEVAAALRAVLDGDSFRAAARQAGEQLRASGGLPQAVQLILTLANSSDNTGEATAAA